MAEDEANFKVDVDDKYKSVVVSYGWENTFDFINGLPKLGKEKIISLLKENKEDNTFIPTIVGDGLYACIYKRIIEGEDDFTLYIFENKKAVITLGLNSVPDEEETVEDAEIVESETTENE